MAMFLQINPVLKWSTWASLVAQMGKNLPAMRETQFWSLGREDPLEEEMATLSSILARIIPWTEESDGLQSMGSERVRHNWVHTHTHTHTQCFIVYKTLLYIYSYCQTPRHSYKIEQALLTPSHIWGTDSWDLGYLFEAMLIRTGRTESCVSKTMPFLLQHIT